MSNKLQITAKVNMRNHFRILVQMVFAIVLLSSCTRTIYQEREVVHHDTTYISKFALDTIIQRDSIRVLQKGDTFKITETKYVYKVRERVDTSYIFATDTLTKTETKEVEKIVKKKDWLSIIGALCIGILIGIITLPIIRIFAGRGRTQSVSSLPPPNKR